MWSELDLCILRQRDTPTRSHQQQNGEDRGSVKIILALCKGMVRFKDG